MRKKLKILITGGGGVGSEAIYRLLRDTYDLYFADCDSRNINPSIPLERCLLIPKGDHEDFLDCLKGLCRDHRIDLLIPTVDEELVKIEVRV